MMRNWRTPASRNASTMCCKTGLPRTTIIGFGRSAVSSRIRVPRPAASRTALSILVITGHRSQFTLLLRNHQRGQIKLFDHGADFWHVVGFDLRPFFQLFVELAAEQLKRVQLRLRRLILADINDVTKTVEALVQHVREGQIS